MINSIRIKQLLSTCVKEVSMMKNRNFKFYIIILIFSIISISLSSCYSNVDLTEIAVATAIGFDRADQGDIRLTVQIVKPGVIKARNQGSEEETVWIFSATGETVFSAIRNLLATVNRKVFYSHLQLIVISEEIAKGGVLDLLDLLERDKEIHRLAYVLVAKGISAEEILKAQSELENVPAIHIKSIIDNYESLAKMRKITLIDLLRDFNHSGNAASTGVIQKKTAKLEREMSQQKKPNNGQESKTEDELEVKDLKVTGTAVFRRDKIAGYLGPYETRGLLFALDEVKSGIINIDNPLHNGKKVAFEIVSSKAKLSAKIKDDQAKLMIEVKAEGRLADQQGSGDLTTPEMLVKMEKSVARVIEKNIQMAVDKAQKEFKLDYFGFSKTLYKNHYSYWKIVESDWSNVFSELPITIEANWNTSSSSLIRSPSEAR